MEGLVHLVQSARTVSTHYSMELGANVLIQLDHDHEKFNDSLREGRGTRNAIEKLIFHHPEDRHTDCRDEICFIQRSTESG